MPINPLAQTTSAACTRPNTASRKTPMSQVEREIIRKQIMLLEMRKHEEEEKAIEKAKKAEEHARKMEQERNDEIEREKEKSKRDALEALARVMATSNSKALKGAIARCHRLDCATMSDERLVEAEKRLESLERLEAAETRNANEEAAARRQALRDEAEEKERAQKQEQHRAALEEKKRKAEERCRKQELEQKRKDEQRQQKEDELARQAAQRAEEKQRKDAEKQRTREELKQKALDRKKSVKQNSKHKMEAQESDAKHYREQRHCETITIAQQLAKALAKEHRLVMKEQRLDGQADKTDWGLCKEAEENAKLVSPGKLSQSELGSPKSSLKPPLRILRRWAKPPELALSAHELNANEAPGQTVFQAEEVSAGGERGCEEMMDAVAPLLESPKLLEFPPTALPLALRAQRVLAPQPKRICQFKEMNDNAAEHMHDTSPEACNTMCEAGSHRDVSTSTTHGKIEAEFWVDAPESPSTVRKRLPFSNIWSLKAKLKTASHDSITASWATAARFATKNNSLPQGRLATKPDIENCDPASSWGKAAKEVATVAISLDRHSLVDCTSGINLATTGSANESDANDVSYMLGQRVYGYFYGNWYPATVRRVDLVEQDNSGGSVEVLWDSEYSTSVLAKVDVAPMFFSQESEHEQ